MIAQALVAAALVASFGVAPAVVPISCDVDDATLTWGFKESFRSYISGTIANGEWTVSDGATYETPNFGFTNGTGSYGDAGNRVSFEGAIRFTGHGGILDTTVSDPRIEWSGANGTLYLSVTGTTQEGVPIDEFGVPFATLVLPTDPPTFDEVTVTLTDEGAAAFGTYEAGEAFDPLTLELNLAGDCALTRAEGPPIGWIAGGAAVVVAAVVTGFIIVRRRRLR